MLCSAAEVESCCSRRWWKVLDMPRIGVCEAMAHQPRVWNVAKVRIRPLYDCGLQVLVHAVRAWFRKANVGGPV